MSKRRRARSAIQKSDGGVDADKTGAKKAPVYGLLAKPCVKAVRLAPRSEAFSLSVLSQ